MRTKKTKAKLPLALGLRPTSLADVVGQDTAVHTLRGMFRGSRINRTISLCGPYSSGKTTIARLIALYLNCANPADDSEPCGKCSSCIAMHKVILGTGAHPDLHEIDAASQRGIDDVRSLKRLAELHPVSNWRIFILDECHMYTPEAWQSSLKLFEHPPGKTIFILCTTEDAKLPQTIRSRAKTITLKAVTPADTVKMLRKVCVAEGYSKLVGKKIRQQIAAMTGGHPRDALTMLESVFDYSDANGAITSPELIKMFPKIVEASPSLKGYIAAQDYVNALLRGQYAPAFKAVVAADNYVSFVNQAVNMLRVHVESIVDAKELIDGPRRWMLSKLRAPTNIDGRNYLAEYGEMLGVLVDAQVKVRGFVADPPATLEVAALECIAITHGILTSKSSGKSAAKPKQN